MSAELLNGSRAVEAAAPLNLVRRDGGRPAATTPEVAPLRPSLTAVEGGEPGQPLYYGAVPPPPPDRPCVTTYTSPEALEAILEAVVSRKIPIRAEPETEPFERELHCWEDDERRRLEVDTNSPRYIARLLNLYRQGLFEPTQVDLCWDRDGRPSLVALSGYSKAPLNLRGWQRRLDGRGARGATT